MASGQIGSVRKEVWLEADKKTKDRLLFDTLETIYDAGQDHCRRIKKLENGRKVDITVAAGTGVLGGFLAVLTKKLW